MQKQIPKLAYLGRSVERAGVNPGTCSDAPTLHAPTLHGLRITSLALALIICLALSVARGQSIPPGTVWVYTLINGSQLVDDCPICDRITPVVPLHGSFQMRLLQQGPLFFTYALEKISFTGSANGGQAYHVTGDGIYRVGGELAAQQSLFLQVFVDNGVTNELCYCNTNLGPVTRLWPMFQVSVDQTNGTITRQIHIDINAAPFRDLWFSTAKGFTAGIWNPPTNAMSAGDLLSVSGRRVESNSALTAKLGVMPSVPDLGLKDISMLPGGEIAFSIDQAVFSETLGQLQSGDVLSNRGRVLRTNQDLIAAFKPTTSGDVGLGALQILDNGETWFSVQSNFVSQALKRTMQSGELLSDQGTLIRSNADLVAQFHPADPTNNFGLNAIYVWPGGEIWFTAARDFSGAGPVSYAAGDLLSDQGYLVYSNAELTSAFAPAGSPANLGLDALYIVTDTSSNPNSPSLALPQITNQPPSSLVLRWTGRGRAFQVQSADNVLGPWSPAGPIAPESVAVLAGAVTNQPQLFYRLQQW